MSVSAKGKFPNHLGWLYKGGMNSILPLSKSVIWGNRETAGKIMWSDWLFGQSSATYSGILKRWTSSTWVKEPLKVFSGTWLSKPLKRWNGSAWVQVDTTGI